MAAGGPGDHPLTDVINYNLKVYGNEADDLLKKLDPLLSRRELFEWWEKDIGWECAPDTALEKIKIRYSLAKERAKDCGWELQ